MINRRRILLSTAAIGTAGTVAGIATPVWAGSHNPYLPLEDQRRLYAEIDLVLFESFREPAWERGNFKDQIRALSEEADVSSNERTFLDRVVSFLFGGEIQNTSDLLERIGEALAEIGNELSEIGKSLLSSLLGAGDSNITFWDRQNGQEDYDRSKHWYVRVLQSAVQGARIGRVIGGTNGAIIGGLIGGAMAAFSTSLC